MKNEAIESAVTGLAKESRWEWELRLVQSVSDAYKQVRQLPVLCATDYNPSPPTRSRRVSPDSVHYEIDVLHAVTFACNGDAEMLASWERLVEDDTVVSNKEAKLIRRLARVFEARGLHPGQYFRIVRRGSPKRRNV
ncbi:hypothetical protein [Granulicella sp. L46]|uniref:hypothetical protein n=1 Tax=Granulicella sp. L46 TaxID=1641865 RepID=UPI00131BD9F2|nr:hypothetical protein [Granulicella sp. L46]